MQNDTVQICNILCTKFLEYRNLRFISMNNNPERMQDDELVEEINTHGFVIIKAERIKPRGLRKNVYVILINAEKANLNKEGILKIYRIVDQKEKDGNELDEVIVIAEPSLLNKKNLSNVLNSKAASNKAGADLKGTMPYYSHYPYTKFRCVVPEHVLVPKHEICPPSVQQVFTNVLFLNLNQFPYIRTDDAMVAWTGARVGELIKITRSDAHTPYSIEYRVVVK